MVLPQRSLHDVVEDTDFTLEELRSRFGDAVANIVDGVTKFDALAGGKRLLAKRNSQPARRRLLNRLRYASRRAN